MTYPKIPSPLLVDWSLMEETKETVLEVPMVSVTNRTRVYEDTGLRQRLSAETGLDTTWRFVFAAGINLDPPVSHSPPLTRLVRHQSFDVFPEQLRDRGFSEVTRTNKRKVSRENGCDVHVRKYDAACSVGGKTIATNAIAGVWKAQKGVFGFAGGAYPIELPPSVDASPSEFRDHLVEVIRRTEVN